MEEYITIGHTKKTYGVNGGLKAHIEDQYLEVLVNAEVVFLKINDKPTPFFIEGIEETNQLVLFFEDVTSKEEAHPFCAREIQVRASDLQDVHLLPPDSPGNYLELMGYEIETKERGTIGTIKEIVELPEQHLAVIQYQNKEVLIPLNDQFIKQVDENNKIIKMELPEGLIELYF